MGLIPEYGDEVGIWLLYPILVGLAEVALSAPITNVCPEREASIVKRIKTRLRNRLKNDVLNTCSLMAQLLEHQ